jgi:putative acetyltransferase
MKRIHIRDEHPADIKDIHELTRLAFMDHPFTRHTEQHIINALRDAGALTLSLVAEVGGKVVGHIAFSPVVISDADENWYGLGPVSVTPGLQKQGIGSMLVRSGLERLKALGGKGCALVGDPAYYGRFGFKNHPALIHEGIPQEIFLVLSLEQHTGFPQGIVTFHEAFSVSAPEEQKE